MLSEDLEPYVKLMGGRMRYDEDAEAWHVSRPISDSRGVRRYVTTWIPADSSLEMAILDLTVLALRADELEVPRG